jgi:hypothetical protein
MAGQQRGGRGGEEIRGFMATGCSVDPGQQSGSVLILRFYNHEETKSGSTRQKIVSEYFNGK